MVLMYIGHIFIGAARAFWSGRASRPGQLCESLGLYRKDIVFTFGITLFILPDGSGRIIFSGYFRIRQNRISALLSAIFIAPLIPFVVFADENSFLCSTSRSAESRPRPAWLVNLKSLCTVQFGGPLIRIRVETIPFAVLIIHGVSDDRHQLYRRGAKRRRKNAEHHSARARPDEQIDIIVALVLSIPDHRTFNCRTSHRGKVPRPLRWTLHTDQLFPRFWRGERPRSLFVHQGSFHCGLLSRSKIRKRGRSFRMNRILKKSAELASVS